MSVATDAPFTAEELAPTLRPLLEASLLPQRAYVDDDVARWEAENFFLGGWVCVVDRDNIAGGVNDVRVSGHATFIPPGCGIYGVTFVARGRVELRHAGRNWANMQARRKCK